MNHLLQRVRMNLLADLALDQIIQTSRGRHLDGKFVRMQSHGSQNQLAEKIIRLVTTCFIHLRRKLYLDGVQTRFIELLGQRKQLVQRLLGAAHPFRISSQRFQDLLLISRPRHLRIQ